LGEGERDAEQDAAGGGEDGELGASHSNDPCRSRLVLLIAFALLSEVTRHRAARQ
jgi:hypothetical protein